LTSGSLSLTSYVNIYIKSLFVISSPKASVNSAKFLATQSLTFHDLSSPASRRVLKVYVLFSSFERCFASGMSYSRHMTLTAS